MKVSCLWGHKWPEVYTKYGERESIDFDGIWWEVFEKKCLRDCGARKTIRGPWRHSKILGGDIL